MSIPYFKLMSYEEAHAAVYRMVKHNRGPELLTEAVGVIEELCLKTRTRDEFIRQLDSLCDRLMYLDCAYIYLLRRGLRSLRFIAVMCRMLAIGHIVFQRRRLAESIGIWKRHTSLSTRPRMVPMMYTGLSWADST